MKLSGNTGLKFYKTSVLLKGITKQRKEMDDEVFEFPNNVFNLRIARTMHKPCRICTFHQTTAESQSENKRLKIFKLFFKNPV